jgi:hypothetical protein
MTFRKFRSVLLEVPVLTDAEERDEKTLVGTAIFGSIGNR